MLYELFSSYTRIYKNKQTMEILEQLQSPAIIAATMAIVGLIKDKWIFAKINTRLVSFVTAILLLILNSYVNVSTELVVTIENVLIVILPAIGYDYIYAPVVKPILDLFKEKV
jgi:hypothetical protein